LHSFRSIDHFNATAIARDVGNNWALRAANLKKLLRNLEEFYHEVLQKDSDFESLSTHINDIAKEEDLDHLMAFVELIAVAVTTCDDKEVFVGRMKEMDHESLLEFQYILQDAYGIITDMDAGKAGEDEDNDSVVFDQEGGGEGSPTAPSLLFPSHGDSKLLNERDELRRALQDVKRELGQAKIDAEDNQKDKEKIRALNQDLQERLAGRDEELSAAEQKISKNKRVLEEAQTEVADLREKSASLADELDVEKSKVLQLRKSEAMVEVYRKKLDNLHSSNHQMGGMEEQTAKYIEQIMTLENENRKIASMQKILEESQSKTKKLESHIAEVDDALKVKDAEIVKLKNEVTNAEKAKNMYQDELNELRAHNEGAADAAFAVKVVSDSNEKTQRLELENSQLRYRMEQMKLSSAADVPTGDQGSLQSQLSDKEAELSKLLSDKEKLEAYTKKTLQKFQEKYLVALQECKAKLKEKHDKIEALEMRSANEKVAQKREEKLLSSAIFELGMGMMSNRLGKR
jgi:protein HOOK3